MTDGTPGENQLSIGQCAALACVLEVTACKPGNVHRGADFEDVTYLDFITSAVTIAPAMERAPTDGVGLTVLKAVRATRRAVRTNTNLGTILLLAPMACVPRSVSLDAGIRDVLAHLTADDARHVYQAIREAKPGGIGTVDRHDVADEAPADLLEAMALAADRDSVARQYVNGFSDVLQRVVPWLSEARQRGMGLLDAIVLTHVRLMYELPDSLIARKCGRQTAEQAAAWAGSVLDSGQPGDASYHDALASLDFWLRSDGHRRNPGTTADLIAAGLFACLRDGIIQAPFDAP